MPEDHQDALRSQLAELEARVRALEAGSTPAPATSAAAMPAAATPAGGTSAGTSPAEMSPAEVSPAARRASAPAGNLEDALWALNSLKAQLPSPGAVMYTGAVDVGLGHVEYQWTRSTDCLLERDWGELAESVTALGHPLRLAILRRLLDGERTVAQLVDELELASTGVAYHHLSALQNGGWATAPRRGSWTIPASRVIPLLAIITALEQG